MKSYSDEVISKDDVRKLIDKKLKPVKFCVILLMLVGIVSLISLVLILDRINFIENQPPNKVILNIPLNKLRPGTHPREPIRIVPKNPVFL